MTQNRLRGILPAGASTTSRLPEPVVVGAKLRAARPGEVPSELTTARPDAETGSARSSGDAAASRSELASDDISESRRGRPGFLKLGVLLVVLAAVEAAEPTDRD